MLDCYLSFLVFASHEEEGDLFTRIEASSGPVVSPQDAVAIDVVLLLRCVVCAHDPVYHGLRREDTKSHPLYMHPVRIYDNMGLLFAVVKGCLSQECSEQIARFGRVRVSSLASVRA